MLPKVKTAAWEIMGAKKQHPAQRCFNAKRSKLLLEDRHSARFSSLPAATNLLQWAVCYWAFLSGLVMTSILKFGVLKWRENQNIQDDGPQGASFGTSCFKRTSLDEQEVLESTYKTARLFMSRWHKQEVIIEWWGCDLIQTWKNAHEVSHLKKNKGWRGLHDTEMQTMKKNERHDKTTTVHVGNRLI